MTTINQPEVKHIFIQQLEALRDVMISSSQEELVMREWITEEPSRSCGYAACVLGDYALNGELEMFGISSSTRDLCSTYDMNPIATNISEALDLSCLDLTGDTIVAESIYEGFTGAEVGRYRRAQDSLFNSQEVESFRHLTERNPTPKDAAEYIQAVIDKLTKDN